ncbi:MAG: MFS transporter [Deltaproteobacteria bacterium CG_4_8_14_3_um_filter_45_9]|jgi:FSR family fosmidomycin resistance protein-like MFS transporter|nr:MAG: MFS transporter [Deltaproteobacteria bacterium CG03_land_8_20_14_0_80_45_14]PIX21852.1 MAG: MFS transporter [Deltaproteobacteria bacterium CG_4_8_14_3_um_filter_45_9]
MKLNKKALAILSAGHLVTDVNQGALPALLPYFKEALNLSYTMSGVILLSANLTSSIIQPAFGHLSDRRPIGWFLPLAPFIACLGLSVTGLISSYSFLILCVILSGIGIASFHPEGFKTAYFFTGDKKATGMSIFAVGGNFGIAVGPMVALTLVTSFGLKGTLAMILPGILIAIVLFFNISMLTTPVEFAHREAKKEVKAPLSKNQKISFFLLVSIATIRAWIQFGLVTYIPFYYINYLKGNPLYAGKLVSTFLMAGVLGTLIGAPLADRWGHKKFLLTSLILSFPLLLLFYYSSGIMAFILLGTAGMVLISTFALTTVMGQALLPQHLGIASGMMVGFTISAGGIGVTLLGAIADTWGVPMAIKTIFVLPLIAIGLALLVKYPPTK